MGSPSNHFHQTSINLEVCNGPTPSESPARTARVDANEFLNRSFHGGVWTLLTIQYQAEISEVNPMKLYGEIAAAEEELHHWQKQVERASKPPRESTLDQDAATTESNL